MRKVLVVLVVAVLAVSAALFAVSCGGNVDVPGTVWANKEICEYGIYDSDNLPVGALIIVTERLATGEQTLNATGAKVNITSSSARGTRVTMKASDRDGNVWLESESILNGFTPAASYRKVSKDGENYTVTATYDGKNYRYRINDGEEKKLRVKSGFIDNELLYTVVRCYTIESAYSSEFTVVDPVAGTKEKVVDPVAGTKEKITAATFGEGDYQDPVEVISSGVEAETKHSLSFTRLSFTRSDSPVGASMYADYTKIDGLKVLGEGSTGLYSVRIPVQIVENDLVYKLVSVQCE